jgi:hypothetical protein
MKVNWTYHGMHIDMTSTQPQKKLCPTWLILIVALDDRNETDDINRSDMDFVTLPNNQTYVVWITGNQGVGTAPNPFLALGWCMAPSSNR